MLLLLQVLLLQVLLLLLLPLQLTAAASMTDGAAAETAEEELQLLLLQVPVLLLLTGSRIGKRTNEGFQEPESMVRQLPTEASEPPGRGGPWGRDAASGCSHPSPRLLGCCAGGGPPC